VAADGFHAWRAVDARKQPYRTAMKDGEPFSMAGLWERWEKGRAAGRELHDHRDAG
jgi:putative SOS response-associated peptidase YedK